MYVTKGGGDVYERREGTGWGEVGVMREGRSLEED